MPNEETDESILSFNYLGDPPVRLLQFDQPKDCIYVCLMVT